MAHDDPLVAFGESSPSRQGEIARREELVAALAATFDQTRFAALWFAARARHDVTRQARTQRPSHASVAASRADGYVEGLRDPACALLRCDPADFFRALESACEEMDFYIARTGSCPSAPG